MQRGILDFGVWEAGGGLSAVVGCDARFELQNTVGGSGSHRGDPRRKQS